MGSRVFHLKIDQGREIALLQGGKELGTVRSGLRMC